jgi:hypothetical protein
LDARVCRKTWRRANRLTRLVGPARHVLGCFIFVALIAAQGNSQISPGPLSKAHESLSGSLKCTKCHDLGSRATKLKCMECHGEIRQRVEKRKGMHAVWLPPGAGSDDCVSCHHEHSGADFPLIRWQPNREAMDHSQTGYPLTGRHATADCNDCHNAAHILPSERTSIMITDLDHSYLGLSRDCASCHPDEHRGQLGTNCAACHTTAAWRPAPAFNHAASKFPLTGAHITVSCDKCHATVAGAKPYIKYVGLSFDNCSACHTDPHKSSLTARCQSCHNTTSWTRGVRPSGFDHSSHFPLLGKHRTVACSDCHTEPDFKAPVAHTKCMDCHNPDPHKGQFDARAAKGECAECHTVDGWKPSSFGVKEHATSAYPLLGKHAGVECTKCHIPAGTDTIFKVTFAQCLDCHQDAHDGQFAKAPYQNRCESCHTVNDFHLSKFTIAMHRDTRFSLDGAHAVVPCSDCHKEGADGRHDKILPFIFEDHSCTACHMDPHRGEFKEQMAERSANGTQLGCEACHNAQSWTDISGFDHSKTAFPLLGAHRVVACAACHLVTVGTDGVVFKGAATNCGDCHVDVHGEQFAKEHKTQCKDCHNPERWAPSTFDHDKRTSLPLTGGHADVSCDACHKQTRLVNGHPVIIYSLAPNKCVDCHATPKTQSAVPR